MIDVHRREAALVVMRVPERKLGEPHVLIEAEIGEGVVSAPLSQYYPFHTRICRPVGLSQEDCGTVCAYATERIGFDYDLRKSISCAT